MGKGGGVFMILGIVFVGMGLSGQRTFFWIGVPFLVVGIVGAVLSLREAKPADTETQAPVEQQKHED